MANDKLEDVKEANMSYLSILSDKVIQMIKEGEKGWETMVPDPVANAITKKKLFGYQPGL